MICHALSGTNHKLWYTFIRHRMGNANNFMENIVRIQDINGQTNRYPTDKKITTKHVVIPLQITDLYAESICTEMEGSITKQHSGGASDINCHCVQLTVKKNQTTRKNTCPVWWNIHPHMIIKITSICRAGEDSRGKVFPSLLQVPFIP